MAEVILEVENLVKDFNSFRAVDGISFNVPKGKVVGLLGPNGAGKTTTIHMLLGITIKSSGTIKYFGKDFYKNKEHSLQRINFTSSYNTLQNQISVNENLLVFAYLYGVKKPQRKIDELLEYFEIGNLRNKVFMDLSAGQKTRANLVKSLINDPEIILMDEPTASLDPDIADKLLSLIEKMRETKNLSILYTSHNMAEVTRICDEVIIMDEGKIVAHDTPLSLTKKIGTAELKIIFDGEKDVLEKYLNKHELSFAFTAEHEVLIKTEEKLIPKLIFGISKENIWIIDIEVKKPTLEDVFLQIARGGNYVAK